MRHDAARDAATTNDRPTETPGNAATPTNVGPADHGGNHRASKVGDTLMRRWRVSAMAVLGLALVGTITGTAIANSGGTAPPKTVAAIGSGTPKTVTAAKPARPATAKKTAAKKTTAKPAVAKKSDWVFPMDGRVTSCPGPRWGSTHQGIDVGDAGAKGGATIKAAAAGRVVVAGYNHGGYGNMVIIKHSGGHHTLYGHAAKVLVKAGQSVKAGQRIALEGSTGHSTGPHLHFEVQNQVWHRINPVTFLDHQGLKVKC